MANSAADNRIKYLKMISVITFAAYFIFLALRVHWSDSELWAIGLSKTFFTPNNPSIDYKFFFNSLLKSVYAFSFDNRQVIDHTRILFAGIGLILLFLVHRTAKLATIAESKAGTYAVFLLASCTLFLSQGFKVRSDLLASVLQLAGIVYFLRLNKRKPSSDFLTIPEMIFAILINVLMLMATPKAVYGLAVNFAFIFSFSLSQANNNWIKRYLLFVFAIPLVILGFFAAFKFQEFLTALDFFRKSYQESPQHPAFWSFSSFSFLFDSITKNLHIFALIIWALISWKKWKGDADLFPFLTATLASFLIILIHNDRLPFFLLSQMIFPVLLAAFALTRIRNYRILLLIGGFALFNALLFSMTMLKKANNSNQVGVQLQIQDYLKSYKNPLYYDATSALPLDNRIFVFPAPQHLGNQDEVLNVLNSKDLSLVFFGNRLFFYLTPMYSALEEKFFIQIGPGVFAKSYVVRSTHSIDEQEWSDICAFLGRPEKIVAYQGANFLSMKIIKDTALTCSGQKNRIEATEPFIAFSGFEPLEFKNGLSFSNVFDHKPFY